MRATNTPPYVPKYLRGQEPPEEAVAVVRCTECGATLALTESGYLACSRRLHGRLRPLTAAAETIRTAWPLLRRKPPVRDRTVVRRLLSVLPPPSPGTGGVGKE